MITRTLISSALVVASLAYAHGNLQQKVATKTGPIVCNLHTVPDAQSRTNAFIYLAPKGWTDHSTLKWLPSQPGAFTYQISATTTDGRYEVTRLGQEAYFWKLGHSFAGIPGFSVHTPVHHATEYLRVLLGRVASVKGIEGVEVVDEVNQPISLDKVPAWIRKAPVPPGETRVPIYENGFLQVKFTQDGRSMTAMMGTSVLGFSSTSVVPGKNVVAGEGGFLTVGPTTLLISPMDAPAEKQKEMKIISGSMQMTGQFLAYVADLTDHLIRMKLGAAAAAQRYHDATFHERSMAQFRDEMHMKDAYSHAFCNYVSDQQDFKDQNGHVVPVPTSFKYAWSDGSGNYLFDDDPTTDMRGLGNGNWKPMQKARIGE